MAEFDPDAFLARSEKREKKSTGFDPDAFLKKTEPQPSAQSVLGGTESSARKVASRAALADTAINALSSTWDLAARIPATAYYWAKEGDFNKGYERAAEEVARTAPIKPDLVGRTLGITNTPQYSGALQRQAAEAIAPVIQENIIQPVASATGLPEGAVADIGAIASIPLAGPTATGVKAVGRGAAAVGRGAYDVGAGALGTATGRVAAPGAQPKPWQQASVRQPVGETYIPADVLEQYRAGTITAEQAQAAARPTSELKGLAATGGTVPYAGQGMRAFGEQLGETYRNPLNLLTDVGLDVVTGGPIPTMGRMGYKGYQAYQANKLSNLGFTPLAPGEASALGGRGGPSGPVAPGGGGGMPFPVPNTPPMLPYSPAGQTPMPMGGPQRAVNIEGNRSVLPYEINTTNSQTARPLAGPVNPAAIQQAATQKITPPTSPLQAAAQQTVQQRAQQAFGGNYRGPVNPATLEATRKLTTEEILAEINKKKAGVFETAGETPVAPVDLQTVRSNFANQIEQQRKNMMETREQNKAIYAGTESSLNQKNVEPVKGYAGPRRAFTPPKSEIVTTDAALKNMIKASGDVKSYKNNIIVNRVAYDDLATSAGVALDWTTAPDVSKMGVADARKATNKWVYDSIKKEAPDLGLGVRGETAKTQMKRANAEIAKEESLKSPEQIAQEAATAKALIERNKRMRGTGNRFEMKSSKPLEDMLGAAQDVMIQKFQNKGESFNTTYTHKGDIVSETKHPGYHSVELEHPNGSRTVFKVHDYGPSWGEKAGQKEYIKTTFDPVGRSKVERSNSPFSDFVSVENVMKKQGK